jgi:hypothetical protein
MRVIVLPIELAVVALTKGVLCPRVSLSNFLRAHLKPPDSPNTFVK